MVIEIALGVVAYILYFAYDYNSIHKNYKVFKSLFLVATILAVSTTVYALITKWNNYNITLIIIFGLLSLVFLGLEIYTLFFSLPFEATYIEQSAKREAYTKGMYAICRHPGVLWYIGLYLCLWGLTWNLLEGVFFSVMIIGDILYVIYQDYYIFPATFSNYHEYKKEVPFLIPLCRGKKYGK